MDDGPRPIQNWLPLFTVNIAMRRTSNGDILIWVSDVLYSHTHRCTGVLQPSCLEGKPLGSEQSALIWSINVLAMRPPYRQQRADAFTFNCHEQTLTKYICNGAKPKARTRDYVV